MQFSPLCGLSCLHFYQEWNFQPLWKVKRLEQFTSWKVRVPDCVFFFREKYEHRYVHIHIHIHNYVHIHSLQVRLRG